MIAVYYAPVFIFESLQAREWALAPGAFELKWRKFAIEQNRMKPSRWRKLVREKHPVVQFREVATHEYVAVAVDGEVTEYGRK